MPMLVMLFIAENNIDNVIASLEQLLTLGLIDSKVIV